MKIKVYANIVVDEVEISTEDFAFIKASHLNGIPDVVFDQVEDALRGKAGLNGIERIDTIDGEVVQVY